MRIQKNGANMNQTVVTTMFWRVVQNYAAFVKVIKIYLYNTMIVLHLTFSRNGSWQEIKPYFLGCESDSECKKLGFYACIEGSCVGKYPNITQLRIIDLSILLYQNIIGITCNRETIVPVQIVQILGLWQQRENIAQTLKVKGTKTAYLTAKHIVCKLAQENLHIIQLVIVAVALITVFWSTIQMLKFMNSQVLMCIQIYIHTPIYLSLIIKLRSYSF